MQDIAGPSGHKKRIFCSGQSNPTYMLAGVHAVLMFQIWLNETPVVLFKLLSTFVVIQLGKAPGSMENRMIRGLPMLRKNLHDMNMLQMLLKSVFAVCFAWQPHHEAKHIRTLSKTRPYYTPFIWESSCTAKMMDGQEVRAQSSAAPTWPKSVNTGSVLIDRYW